MIKKTIELTEVVINRSDQQRVWFKDLVDYNVKYSLNLYFEKYLDENRSCFSKNIHSSFELASSLFPAMDLNNIGGVLDNSSGVMDLSITSNAFNSPIRLSGFKFSSNHSNYTTEVRLVVFKYLEYILNDMSNHSLIILKNICIDDEDNICVLLYKVPIYYCGYTFKV